jgi:predicted RNA-binding protein with PIN domain
MYKIHHPEADIHRLYVEGKEAEKGLLQIAVTDKAEIITIAGYTNTKYTEEEFVNTVKSHKKQSTKYEFNNQNSRKGCRRIKTIK